MTKKVAKRGWSLNKFTKVVKAACDRAGVRFSQAKCEAAYNDNYTVAYTVAQMSVPGKPAKAKQAEASGKPAEASAEKQIKQAA